MLQAVARYEQASEACRQSYGEHHYMTRDVAHALHDLKYVCLFICLFDCLFGASVSTYYDILDVSLLQHFILFYHGFTVSAHENKVPVLEKMMLVTNSVCVCVCVCVCVPMQGGYCKSTLYQ